jgi:hypothetical protein
VSHDDVLFGFACASSRSRARSASARLSGDGRAPLDVLPLGRRLALPTPARPQHPYPSPEPGRRLRRTLRAASRSAQARAACRSLPSRRAGRVDCFYVGRLSGTKGAVWQYTAIDVASGYAWAELHSSTAQSQARHCSALVRRVASDLAHAGWRLEAVHACQGRLKTDSSRRLKTDPSGHCLPASGHCLPASGRSPARP